MKKLLLLTLLCIGSYCPAQGWNYLAEYNNTMYYYKLNTGNTAWVKVVTNKASDYASTDDSNPSTIEGYTIYLYKYSCTSKKIGILKTITYSNDGKLLDTKEEYVTDMEPVKPDSVGEELLFELCYGR